MYPDVHFLGGKLITVGEVWVTTEDPRTPWRLTFLSLSLLHKEGDQSLMVDLEVVSKSSQTFLKQIHNPEASGRPTTPRVSQQTQE
jgi:hypothetical protein